MDRKYISVHQHPETQTLYVPDLSHQGFSGVGIAKGVGIACALDKLLQCAEQGLFVLAASCFN